MSQASRASHPISPLLPVGRVLEVRFATFTPRHNNSTIVHVLDFTALTAYTAVTPFSGGFMRLTGTIDVKSG